MILSVLYKKIEILKLIYTYKLKGPFRSVFKHTDSKLKIDLSFALD